MELARGIEPPTYGLQNHCSAVELRQHITLFGPVPVAKNYIYVIRFAPVQGSLNHLIFMACHEPERICFLNIPLSEWFMERVNGIEPS